MRNNLLSQIKILPADRIYPFEWFESKQNTIACHLEDIHLIRNPFMVTPLSEEDYLLLGETALFRVLLAAGLKHIPVQLCPPENIHLYASKLNLIKFTIDGPVRFRGKVSQTCHYQPPAEIIHGRVSAPSFYF